MKGRGDGEREEREREVEVSLNKLTQSTEGMDVALTLPLSAGDGRA